MLTKPSKIRYLLLFGLEVCHGEIVGPVDDVEAGEHRREENPASFNL